MAEEDLALNGADDAALEEGAALEDNSAPDPVATLASEMGWKPKDQWQGDPDAWKEPADFIRTGREIQQTTARELKGMREQIERLGGVTETIVKDKVAERDAFWQSKFDEAVEAGDTEAARTAAKQLNGAGDQTQRQSGVDPQVTAWVGKNAWYNADPLAQARAQELSDRLKHLPVADQLTQVERAIRREFPEHFPKAKDPPGVQTSQSRNPNPSNRVKGFAELPAATQQVALDYEKRLGVPKEKTAQSYWAEQERVKR